MKILSFDVGIKNLAYCYLEYKEQQINIIEWDIINICREKHWICKNKKKKNKELCNKQAKYFKFEELRRAPNPLDIRIYG